MNELFASWTSENRMQLTVQYDHNRSFELFIEEGQLAGLMVAAQEKVGGYETGSKAKQDLAEFLNMCEDAGIDPANHGLT